MAITINLGGSDGNAFALMGTARSICKQVGDDPKPIIEDMTSGDYKHLLTVFCKAVGFFVEFVNVPTEYVDTLDAARDIHGQRIKYTEEAFDEEYDDDEDWE